MRRRSSMAAASDRLRWYRLISPAAPTSSSRYDPSRSASPDVHPLRVERREEGVVHAREGGECRAGCEPRHQLVTCALAASRESDCGDHEEGRRDELHHEQRLRSDGMHAPRRHRRRGIEAQRKPGLVEPDERRCESVANERCDEDHPRRPLWTPQAPARHPRGERENGRSDRGPDQRCPRRKAHRVFAEQGPRHGGEHEIGAGEKAERRRQREVVRAGRPAKPPQDEEGRQQRDHPRRGLDRRVQRGASIGEVDERKHHHERRQTARKVGYEHGPVARAQPHDHFVSRRGTLFDHPKR